MIPPDIIFQEEDDVNMPPSSKTEEGASGQTTPKTEGQEKEKNRISSRLPIAIGIVAALIILFGGWYLIRIEMPYRRRRRAYKKNHETRLRSYGKPDDKFKL